MSKVLQCHCRGNVIDVVVDDEDKCNLIDVLNDLVDEAEKKGIKLPKYPTLSYIDKQEHWKLNDDLDLMKMFGVKTKTVIPIWVGELDRPNDIWKTAMTLRKSKTSKGETSLPQPSLAETTITSKTSFRQKLPTSKEPRGHDISPTRVSASLTQSSPLRISPRFMSPMSPQPTSGSHETVSSPKVRSSNKEFIIPTDGLGSRGKKSLEWYQNRRMSKSTKDRLTKLGILIGESSGVQEDGIGNIAVQENAATGNRQNDRRCRVRLPRVTQQLDEESGGESDDEDYEPGVQSESDDNVSLADDVHVHVEGGKLVGYLASTLSEPSFTWAKIQKSSVMSGTL